MQIKDVTRIRLTAGRPLQHQRHLPVSHRVLGKIIIHDQRVHVVVHEPLTHRCTGERRKILVGRRITRRGSHHDRVLQGPGRFQISDHLGHVGALLAHGHVNAVERAESLNALVLLVDAGVVDDRVNGHGRLAGLAVTNDQLTLATANRDHCIHGHNTRLHRLANRLPVHDSRGNFFHRIRLGVFDLALLRIINRLAQCIHHAAQQAFAHGHGKQLAGGAHLGALVNARVIAQDHRAHLGFLEVQRQPADSTAEIQPLVHHRAGEALDLRHAITNLAHHTHIFPCHICLGTGNLGFNILQ